VRELKNEFSWSWSRHRAFATCPRLYWLAHYGFWNGWQRGAPSREIYIQKRLNTRPQWLGTQVHAAAEWVLSEVRSGRPPAPERAVERARRQAVTMIGDSERGLYRHDPKRKPGFVEHYYGEEIPPDAWEGDIDEIARQVAGLFENPVFLRLCRVPEQIDEVEELAQVRIDGVPVWVSLDVLVRDSDGGRVVIDWKTGRAHESDTVAQQLGVYGAYVAARYFDAPPDGDGPLPDGRIKAMYVNLRSGDYETFTIDAATIRGSVAQIRSSVAAMYERLADVRGNIAREEDFPMLPAGDPQCARCAYRRSCGRDGSGRADSVNK
jgi:hypothetical protein